MSAPLRDVQRWVLGRVTAPLSASTDGGDAASQVTPGPRLSAPERIEIYHRAYWGRLVECLTDDYPALAHAMGEGPFEALCHDYIARHPSTGPNLNHFGRHMSALCKERACEPLPSGFASDLAAIEWAIVLVLHAPPTAPLAPDALQQIPTERWENVRFEPGAAFRILELAYPANAYFQKYKDDEPAEVPEAAWSCTAVYRDGYTIWRWDMSRAMTLLLRQLVAGATLGDALGSLEQDPEMLNEAMASLGGWFREWVSRGFFAKVVEGP